MRLLGYVRVSTDDQKRNGVSLDQQPERLRMYCTLRQFELVGVLTDEGISAGKPLGCRPAGAELLQRLREREVDGVVTTHLDRMFRRASDGFIFLEQIVERRGVTLHVVDQAVDTSTPGGWLCGANQLVSAEYERRMDIHRATVCNATLRAQGRVYGGVPYGCVERAGHLFREPLAWARREMIVRNLRNGLSVRMQQAALADLGIRSPTGKARWSLNTLWALQNLHDELARLPFVAQPAATPSATAETGISHGTRLN